MDNYNGEREMPDRYSLRGKVFHRLREDILSGKYAQNDELREAAISKSMGVSRTPVREALRQLELEGLVTIIPNITEEQLDNLDEITYLSDFHIQREHWEQIFELDNRFHLLLYKACGSTVLEHILSDYHHYVERVRKNTLSSQGRAGKAAEEHKAILNAVREKNEELAEKLANEHIYRSLENIKKQGMENLMK